MGIDVHVLSFLMDSCKPPLGDTLVLGRQEIHVNPLDSRFETVTRAGAYCPERLVDAITGHHYADELFKKLGSRNVSSMDISAFEGAEVIHDLNDPVPTHLHNKYDFIFDGGTLEHVFNFPQAIANVKRMLREDGLFVFVNAANNMLGHGLYQFSPELLWRLFNQPGAYEVELMRVVDTTKLLTWADAPDPDSLGYRNEVSTTPGPAYLMMAARKRGNSVSEVVYQSDYVRQWQK